MDLDVVIGLARDARGACRPSGPRVTIVAGEAAAGRAFATGATFGSATRTVFVKTARGTVVGSPFGRAGEIATGATFGGSTRTVFVKTTRGTVVGTSFGRAGEIATGATFGGATRKVFVKTARRTIIGSPLGRAGEIATGTAFGSATRTVFVKTARGTVVGSPFGRAGEIATCTTFGSATRTRFVVKSCRTRASNALALATCGRAFARRTLFVRRCAAGRRFAWRGGTSSRATCTRRRSRIVHRTRSCRFRGRLLFCAAGVEHRRRHGFGRTAQRAGRTHRSASLVESAGMFGAQFGARGIAHDSNASSNSVSTAICRRLSCKRLPSSRNVSSTRSPRVLMRAVRTLTP